MMVAATDGNTPIAIFERYFSMPTPPRAPRMDAGTLRHIKGSTATDRWQFDTNRLTKRSGFKLDLQEHDLAGGLVKHVMFHARFTEVGFAEAELGLGTLPIGCHDGHFARGHGNDDVVHLVNVMTGGAARGQPPLGDADLWRVDLNVRFGALHDRILQTSGHKYQEYEYRKHHQMNQPEQYVGAAGAEGQHAQQQRHH